MATRNSTVSLSLIAALAGCAGPRVTTSPRPSVAPAVTRASLPHMIDSITFPGEPNYDKLAIEFVKQLTRK